MAIVFLAIILNLQSIENKRVLFIHGYSHTVFGLGILMSFNLFYIALDMTFMKQLSTLEHFQNALNSMIDIDSYNDSVHSLYSKN